MSSLPLNDISDLEDSIEEEMMANMFRLTKMLLQKRQSSSQLRKKRRHFNEGIGFDEFFAGVTREEKLEGNGYYTDNDDDVTAIQASIQKQIKMLERCSQTNARDIQLKEYDILMKDTSEMTEDQLAIHLEYCNDIRQRWQTQPPP
ncbi:PREDICTED: uncharacterized protein LOC109165557 isoform X1 [Ipomoea nil]|uniref:uncharacterized protein LOC109165557 isoform X1 n=1 Tax=Ipomoea nil TaxID=35883 RepID=UPI0009010976|nr:PREDICTED: uncharacterized protein LOC109165557 isoform X1 [Ipomoea nil]